VQIQRKQVEIMKVIRKKRWNFFQKKFSWINIFLLFWIFRALYKKTTNTKIVKTLQIAGIKQIQFFWNCFFFTKKFLLSWTCSKHPIQKVATAGRVKACRLKEKANEFWKLFFPEKFLFEKSFKKFLLICGCSKDEI